MSALAGSDRTSVDLPDSRRSPNGSDVGDSNDILIPDDAVTLEATYSIGEAQERPNAPTVADPAAVYGNGATFLGQAFAPAGQANTPAITRMMADDLTLIGSAPYSIGRIRFSVCNLNAAAVSARPLIRFYLDNAGTPGALIASFSINPITLAASNCSSFSANVPPFTATSSQLWAGMLFDNGSGATASAAEIDLFGMGHFNPPDAGSSSDIFYRTDNAPPSGGSFLVNNPGPGTTGNIGGNPVANFGWELRVVSNIVSIARTDPNPAPPSSVVQWTLTTSGAQLTGLSTTNFAFSGTHTGAAITNVSQTTSTTWNITATLGAGGGTLGLNLANINNANTNVSNLLPFVGESYSVVVPTPTPTPKPTPKPTSNGCKQE